MVTRLSLRYGISFRFLIDNIAEDGTIASRNDTTGRYRRQRLQALRPHLTESVDSSQEGESRASRLSSPPLTYVRRMAKWLAEW